MGKGRRGRREIPQRRGALPLLWLLALSGTGALGLSAVRQRVTLIETGFRIDGLEKRRLELLEETRVLRFEGSRLSRPERIEALWPGRPRTSATWRVVHLTDPGDSRQREGAPVGKEVYAGRLNDFLTRSRQVDHASMLPSR